MQIIRDHTGVGGHSLYPASQQNVCERVTKWETNYWLFDPQYMVNNISTLLGHGS